MNKKRIIIIAILTIILFWVVGFQTSNPFYQFIPISETEIISSKDEVAEYIHLNNRLPDNYLTKKEATKLGWDEEKGNLWEVAEGMSIGGDRFYNLEGNLPSEEGRIYYECDIDYQGGKRNEKRIVYSNDGLIYYTNDHYVSFTLLYGE